MRSIKEDYGLEMKFNEKDLLLYLERAPQGRIFRGLYTSAHFQGMQVGFGNTHTLLYLLNDSLHTEIPESMDRNKCRIFMSGKQIKYVGTPEYEAGKQNLIASSENKQVTELKVMEIELISLMLRSLDVLCMAYVSAMSLPERLRKNLHSDASKKERTDAFEEAERWIEEHPDQDVPVRITETIKRRVNKLHLRFIEIDRFYSSLGSALLSEHSGAYTAEYRKEIFDVFGRDFRDFLKSHGQIL